MDSYIININNTLESIGQNITFPIISHYFSFSVPKEKKRKVYAEIKQFEGENSRYLTEAVGARSKFSTYPRTESGERSAENAAKRDAFHVPARSIYGHDIFAFPF